MSAACKLRRTGMAVWAALLSVALSGCATHPAVPLKAPPAQAARERPASHLGVPYDIVANESLLTILVYRGGTLASVGHNHVIASHALGGTIYVPGEVLKASFEVHVPVASLTVDEETLRAQEHNADFPPGVPQSAKEGTRRNMLGAALLDAAHDPEIVLRALGLESQPPASATHDRAAARTGTVLAHVQTSVRGAVRSILVPVRYELEPGRVTVAGETTVKQSELGLTPFSAFLGALQVQDEMRVRFRIVARAARRGIVVAR